MILDLATTAAHYGAAFTCAVVLWEMVKVPALR